MDKTKPIIALDFASENEAKQFLNLFQNDTLNLKVGMEMYYTYGPDFVRELIAEGHSVFLDLKLHDIPNTVKRAMRQLAQLGVHMVNVHASGGVPMMKAALKGLTEGTPVNAKPPLLIAVTQLTSTTEKQVELEQVSALSLEDSILNYAKLTKASGLAGVVCSPHEVTPIKQLLGEQFLTVTPGIRPLSHDLCHDDQHRITTPHQAKQLGSDYIVVGRPITQATQPYNAYQSITQEWSAK